MAAELNEDWVESANDALTVSLVTQSSSGAPRTIAQFNPRFTYPVFGEDERIFGYTDLKVSLQYNANDMRPNLQVSYGKKFRAIGQTEPADIHAIMHDFLPEVAFAKQSDFHAAIQAVPKDWTPPGSLFTTLATGDGDYEIWEGSLADPAVKQMMSRIQILILLFVEGGSFIGTNDSDSLDRWTIYFLYQKKASPGGGNPSYVFAGYATVYRFVLYQLPKLSKSPATIDDFELPDGTCALTELPCRSRISQFVILPPFQGKGVGSALYSAIFKKYHASPQTIEMTVEDPNEAFDDLRDLADLAFLRTVPGFTALKLNTALRLPKAGPAPKNIVDPAAAEAVRQGAKIAPRQFARVLELHLMSTLHQSVRRMLEDPDRTVPREHEHEYKLWRLLAKQRLYRHNKDMLGQLERDERIAKLDETMDGVEFDYARLLAKFERANGSEGANGKRKREEEHEESSTSKKVRVEDAWGE